jgi:heme/copper-type cytochrome/quinol oxidase subunit 1
MTKNNKQFLLELLWLALSLGLTILLLSFLFGLSLSQNTIDIHLHDTMFVISRWHFFSPLFFLVIFIIYFIKEFRKSFSRTLPNLLLIIAGMTLVILLTFLIQTFSQFLTGGWTLYPPLSALGPDEVPEMTQDTVTKFITNFLTVIQIVVLLMLLFVTYRWGTQTRKESSE